MSAGQSARTASEDLDSIYECDAVVLFSEDAQEFVDKMIKKLTEYGFKIRTREDLLAGHPTEYVPMTRIISKLCRRIILVYTPKFFSSHDMSFYMDYAHADTVKTNPRRSRLIPIMYISCVVPEHLQNYYQMDIKRFDEDDIWEELKQILENARRPLHANE